MDFLNNCKQQSQEWSGIVRAKGFFWLSTRTDLTHELSAAGKLVRHQILGRWWATTDKSRWPNSQELRETMAKHWDEKSGDRRQCIVFIGLKDAMDQDMIETGLNACLVHDYWSDPELYHSLNDPFPISDLIDWKLKEATELAGELHMQRKIAECVALFSEILNFIDEKAANAHIPEQRINVLIKLAVAYQQLGDFSMAITYLTQAKEIGSSNNLPDATNYAEEKLNFCQAKHLANEFTARAKQKYLEKDLDNALNIYKQLLGLLVTRLPYEQESLATCHYNLGMTHKYLKNYSSAHDHCKEAFEMRKRLFGALDKKTKSVEKKLLEINSVLKH